MCIWSKDGLQGRRRDYTYEATEAGILNWFMQAMNSRRSKRHTKDNTTKCSIRGGHFGSRSCVLLKPLVPDFGGEKAYPLVLSEGGCFLPTVFGSGWVPPH